MKQLFDHRFLVIAGKGGVGRTTVAAALARAATRNGKRVLLAQTNAPERLGRLLGLTRPIGPEVSSAGDGLDVVNMRPKEALHEYGVMLLRYEPIYRAVFENKPMRSFLGAFPGLDYWTMLGKAWWHTTERENGRAKYGLVMSWASAFWSTRPRAPIAPPSSMVAPVRARTRSSSSALPGPVSPAISEPSGATRVMLATPPILTTATVPSRRPRRTSAW